ncbi:MAG: hypothetical protein AABX93_02505 [Nanoarchaeota archaeon]
MKKSVIAFSLLMLLAVSMVSATDTMIKVKTLSNHTVDVYALRIGETYSLIESFHKISDSNGEALVTLSTNEEEFNLKVDVRKDNVIIVSVKKFNETYASGTPVQVELYPQWYLDQLAIEQSGNFADGDNSSALVEEQSNVSEVSEENLSLTEVEEITEKSSDDSNAITGFFTSLREKVSKKTLYYSVVFVLLVGGFFFWKKRRHLHHEPKEPKEIIVRKLSEINDAKKSLVEEAERKIADLQDEIKKIKGS